MNEPIQPEPKPRPRLQPEDMIPHQGLPTQTGSSQGGDFQLRDRPAEFDPSAHKFELEPPGTPYEPEPYVPAYEHLGELPSRYGTGKLFLAARDPQWLFAYWDFTFDQLVGAEREAHDGKLFLQIYLTTGERTQQIHITPNAGEWMIHVHRPNTTFYAELGFYRFDGSFEVMSRSGETTTPRISLSENTEVRFVTIPFRFSFAELREIVKGLGRPDEGLAETLARLQADGHPLPFDHYQGPALSPEERQRMHNLFGSEFLKRTWIDSQEIIERITHRFELRSADSSGQWPPSSHWLSSPSSPFGGNHHPFFMHLNAELILYGGTDPSASLRIDGKDVELDANGNFHFHFNFPDGKYHVPVEATSRDGETRSALISFCRLSAFGDGVDSTRQPARDEPMGRLD